MLYAIIDNMKTKVEIVKHYEDEKYECRIISGKHKGVMVVCVPCEQ